MSSKKESPKLYEIKITLMELTPAIWRRVLVPRDILLADLHQVIQIAMGWQDSHLHEFEIGKKRYGPLLDDPFDMDDAPLNEDIVHLNGVAKTKAKFVYAYDFGDDWRHEIRIERAVESASGQREVCCIAGENACPPEDSGGPFGYPSLLDAIADPQHEQHDEIREWMGEDFDPLRFDLASTNRRLTKLKV